jgi:hypothetical protein
MDILTLSISFLLGLEIPFRERYLDVTSMFDDLEQSRLVKFRIYVYINAYV